MTLRLASAYDRDFERWTDAEGRVQRLEWLASVPLITSVGGVFRWDVSALDGSDVLGSASDVELGERLRAICSPTRAPGPIPGHDEAPGVAAKLMSDIDHLIAHRVSGADAFVTLDVSTILSRRAALQVEGILVCAPTEALLGIDRP